MPRLNGCYQGWGRDSLAVRGGDESRWSLPVAPKLAQEMVAHEHIRRLRRPVLTASRGFREDQAWYARLFRSRSSYWEDARTQIVQAIREELNRVRGIVRVTADPLRGVMVVVGGTE